jgi:hypothetical protein
MFQDEVSITVLEPLLISGIDQQRYINSGPKTASDGILEPLMMTFSVVVYDDILVILIDSILLINIKFVVKYHYRVGNGVKGMAVSMWWKRGGMTAAAAAHPLWIIVITINIFNIFPLSKLPHYRKTTFIQRCF